MALRGGGANSSLVMSTTTENTQIIKKSLAFRAKYRVTPEAGQLLTLGPGLVVPHVANRGGEPVKSLRTKELTADICTDGCDVTEATSNAVAVQAMPDKDRQEKNITSTMQSLYEEATKMDPDMVDRVHGVEAIAGSLSHSHFNCVLRNILGAKKGCVCEGSVVTECKCSSKPILNQDRNYDLEKLSKYDKRWHDLTTTGLPWEILSWKMDVEEPEAASIISIALNKKTRQL